MQGRWSTWPSFLEFIGKNNFPEDGARGSAYDLPGQAYDRPTPVIICLAGGQACDLPKVSVFNIPAKGQAYDLPPCSPCRMDKIQQIICSALSSKKGQADRMFASLFWGEFLVALGEWREGPQPTHQKGENQNKETITKAKTKQTKLCLFACLSFP